MSGEIKHTCTLSADKGNFSLARQGKTLSVDMNGNGGATPGTVSVLVAGTTIDLSELTTPGIGIMTNLDTVNFVTFGGVTDQPFKLKAGEQASMRMNPGETLKMVADTAACKVLIQFLED